MHISELIQEKKENHSIFSSSQAKEHINAEMIHAYEDLKKGDGA